MTALYGLGMMTLVVPLIEPRSRPSGAVGHRTGFPGFGLLLSDQSFNFWIAAAASLIPLTLGLDAMRQLVFASGPALGFLDVRVE